MLIRSFVSHPAVRTSSTLLPARVEQKDETGSVAVDWPTYGNCGMLDSQATALRALAEGARPALPARVLY